MYGQLIIGPPGAGKTTYCFAMAEFINGINKLIYENITSNSTDNERKPKLKKVGIINLDPANECVTYEPDIDIRAIISLNEVMMNFKLGPNGAMLKCMNMIDENFDWLAIKIKNLISNPLFDIDYFLIDCPGQVELFIHHNALLNIIGKLSDVLQMNLVVANLIDSVCIDNPPNYIASTLTSLISMLHLSLPQINILSKIDTLDKDCIDLPYYCEIPDMNYFMQAEISNLKKFQKLNELIGSVIEDYSLVNYMPCNINDKISMANLLKHMDKAVGYSRGSPNIYKVQDQKISNTEYPSYHSKTEKTKKYSSDDQPLERVLFPILYDPKISKFVRDINFFQTMPNSVSNNIKNKEDKPPESLLQSVLLNYNQKSENKQKSENDDPTINQKENNEDVNNLNNNTLQIPCNQNNEENS